MPRIRVVKKNGDIHIYEAATEDVLLEQITEDDTYEIISIDSSINILEESPVYIASMAKAAKIVDVSSIVVTVGTKVFDGDEISQGRMLRAIQIAAVTGETTTMWKLADNSIVEVTLDELKEALALSGKEMSKIWLGV